MFLSDLSIKRPVLATMMILALVVLGFFSYRRLGIDQWPNVEFPFLSVETRYAGASPEAVEREVTKRIEEAIHTASGVKQIQSVSTEGYSQIYVQFHLGTKIQDAQADVRAKIDALRLDLPKDIDPPVVSRFDPGQQPIMSFAVRGQGWSLRDLTQLAEETVSKRVENIPGVGNVGVVGGLRREIHALLLPDRMEALGVSPDMVMAALRRENADTPAGRVERGSRENLVRLKGRLARPEDFANVIVATRDGSSIRLGQVARVEDAQEEERDAAYLDGQRAVAVEVRKQSGGNTVAIAEAVHEAIAELNQTLPTGVTLSIIQDNSTYIHESVDDVQRTLVEGAILTVLIVFVFLNSWRSTVITGLTLPVSVISAFLAIYAFGFTLNTMTLMALSLVIGILIDDAIVVRENIVRHLERGKDHFAAAREGTAEIGFAVLATTASILAVFVPVAFMGGIVGRFFYPFGITVAFAVLVSLFVSFTLDPMLSSRWYDPHAEAGANRGRIGRLLARFNDSFAGLGRRYRGLIEWALRHRALTLGIAALSFVAAIAMVATGIVGGQFMPKSDEGQTLVAVETPVGSSISYTAAKTLDVAAYIRRQPEVAYTYATVGGAQQNNAVNKGQVYVKLKPRTERKRSQQELEAAFRLDLGHFQGVSARVLQIGAVGGAQAPIVLNLRGENLGKLDELSQTTLEKLRDVPGLVELKSSLEGRKPEVVVAVNRDLAAELGLSVGAVGDALRPVLSGQKAGDWEDPTGLAHDVIVRMAPEARTSQADLARIPIATSQIDRRTGQPVMVPLGQVATFSPGGAPDRIDRKNLQRVATIEGNYQNRPLTDVVRDIQSRIGTLSLPAGYRFDFGGEQEDFVETIGFMSESLALAIVFIYLILASQFGSFLQPLAIMLSLPLSLIGVMLGLAVTRGTLNIMSMIGIIMLMGLVTKNAILLVDFANAARERGFNRRAALVEAGELRLRPIVMTTLAMIFGMLPTALALGQGAEFRAPMAHAVIGGLITSTLLTLIVVPVVYTLLDDFGTRVRGLVLRFTQPPDHARSHVASEPVAAKASPRRETTEAAAPEPAPEPEPAPAGSVRS
ncbi:MAG TPA: efflux RND transporter permease subunit [Candidatus Eisenbacteria bacterium]|nr:efflux RND transporter permease subunit [Candidatus Eisenbacteria bacterium]